MPKNTASEGAQNEPDYELLCVIVNFGVGSKVVKLAKKQGVRGGTIFLGMGTVKNRILQFLELNDIRKEIVFMAAESSVAKSAMDKIDRELELKKPYHGIAFSMPLTAFIGSERHKYSHRESGGGKKRMHNAMFVITEKGKSELVMEAATTAGARGGTVIKARGTGGHEESKLFNIVIEPEKEIVLILSDESSTEGIASAIHDKLEIGTVNKGVIFCLDVNRVYGMS